MIGFKIRPKHEEPTERYAYGLCRRKGDFFRIQVDRVGDQCHMVYASSVTAGGQATWPPAKNEIILDGAQVYLTDKFLCPSCKNSNIVSCGLCGKIACWDGLSKSVICLHCKHEGNVTGRMKAVAVESFNKENNHGEIKHNKPKPFSAF